MSKSSPQAVFELAQAAIERQDREAFFDCLDTGDLVRISENSFNVLLNRSLETQTALMSLCNQHDFPDDVIEALRERGNAIAESARGMALSPLAAAPGADPAAQREAALQHRDQVKNYNKVLKDALKSLPNLNVFAASLELQMRAAVGGGSVSLRLFQGESLDDIVIDGKRAWATRRGKGDRYEEIGFVQKRGGWFIKLKAKRPK